MSGGGWTTALTITIVVLLGGTSVFYAVAAIYGHRATGALPRVTAQMLWSQAGFRAAAAILILVGAVTDDFGYAIDMATGALVVAWFISNRILRRRIKREDPLKRAAADT